MPPSPNGIIVLDVETVDEYCEFDLTACLRLNEYCLKVDAGCLICDAVHISRTTKIFSLGYEI